MHVSAFMVPADKVFTCTGEDTIQKVLDTVVQHQVSAVVVTGHYGEPAGLVTNTNLAAAYQQGVDRTAAISTIMSTQLDTLLDTDSRDTAASMLEQCSRHHAVVVNAQGHFVGLISAFDVVSEVAKDARAWPWMRTDDGKVHPTHKQANKDKARAATPAAGVAPAVH